MTASHTQDADALATMAPELVAPLVSLLVSEHSQVNGQVLVAGRGWARRSATVELESLVYVGPAAPTDASAQRFGDPLRIEGFCREFSNALESYADFQSSVVGDLRQP
jgi:hypothetical protein